MSASPFDDRTEMSAAEYRDFLAGQGQTLFVPRAPVETPAAWQTNEKAFLQKVSDYATAHGWRVSHAWKSANSEPGVPDLKMIRRGVLRYAELKVPGGRITKDQRWWLDELSKVSGVGVHLWYPEDWPEIERILR